MIVTDLFSEYRTSFTELDSKEHKLEYWYNYMERDIEIRDKCIDDYVTEGYDWKKIAEQKVFVYDDKDLARMHLLPENILEICKDINLNSILVTQDEDISVVIYHGIGNGAGWATTHKNKPSILLGVEKIVELGWENKITLTNLIAHEYAHLLHNSFRHDITFQIDSDYKRYIFKLYYEGFATYYENFFFGREKSDLEWYKKCVTNYEDIKKEYLVRLENNPISCLDFYGDWYKIFGISDTGYFLGSKLIEFLLENFKIEIIMCFTEHDIITNTLAFLRNYCTNRKSGIKY